MAFFKFRLPGQPTSEPQGNHSNTPAESVEAMRRRARHRLIGASVLVVLGVVGFPLLFDTQPRPVSVDIAVTIPDRADSKPLVDTAKSKAKPLSTAAGLDAKEEVVPDAKPEPKPEAKVEPKAAERKPDVATKVDPKSADPLGDLAKAKTAEPKVVDAKPVEVKPAETKAAAPVDPFIYFVQAGAYRTADEAEAQRAKLALLGLDAKISERDQGGRTVHRVRVGPMDKADAERVRTKLEAAHLDSAMVRVQR